MQGSSRIQEDSEDLTSDEESMEALTELVQQDLANLVSPRTGDKRNSVELINPPNYRGQPPAKRTTETQPTRGAQSGSTLPRIPR